MIKYLGVYRYNVVPLFLDFIYAWNRRLIDKKIGVKTMTYCCIHCIPFSYDIEFVSAIVT